LIFFTWLNPLFELFFSPWLTEVDCALRREVRVVLVQVVTALSCIIAFCLNYTIFLNTTLNSALTQTMCGNLKDLGTVFFGWICFGGLPFDWLNVFGQCLGFLGSGMYAYCKLKGK
jgi:drug/metabolite transporter (DMT)-like permease